MFEKFGEIEECKALLDKTTSESRGCGFVHYVHPSDAEAAVRDMNGSIPRGSQQPLQVRFANVTHRDSRSSGPTWDTVPTHSREGPSLRIDRHADPYTKDKMILGGKPWSKKEESDSGSDEEDEWNVVELTVALALSKFDSTWVAGSSRRHRSIPKSKATYY